MYTILTLSMNVTLLSVANTKRYLSLTKIMIHPVNLFIDIGKCREIMCFVQGNIKFRCEMVRLGCDMIVGSVHTTCYIETLYWLDKCGYDGWLSMDQYPYREDATGAITESILWLNKFDEIVKNKREKIDELITLNDAVETSKFLRCVLI